MDFVGAYLHDCSGDECCGRRQSSCSASQVWFGGRGMLRSIGLATAGMRGLGLACGEWLGLGWLSAQVVVRPVWAVFELVWFYGGGALLVAELACHPRLG